MTDKTIHESKIVRLEMLDTDYAKMMAGEPIAQDRRDRIESADAYTLERLEKQISRYRYGQLDQEGKDSILCDVGLTAELLTPADMEDIHQRTRDTGRFYLTDGERQQILNWLQDELAVDLMSC
ncbi:MAG: hypothetical protein AAFR18_21730 [Cyanobacteria bacterium J06627_32]